MALGDWTRNVLNETYHSVSLEVNTPLVGNGSVIINMGTSTTAFGGVNMYYTAQQGFTKGRIRTIMRMDYRPRTYEWQRGGIVCMQSHLNPVDNNAAWYAFSWGLRKSTISGSPGQQYWMIEKHTADQIHEVATGTEIDYEGVSVSDGDYYPVQLEWVADIPNLGGTRLTASVGTLNSVDFSTMVEVLDYIDTSSPLITTLGEGLFACQPQNSSSGSKYTFDETSVYQLV